VTENACVRSGHYCSACHAGYRLVSDDNSAVCTPCEQNTYQASYEFYGDVCTPQPVCNLGQYITSFDTEKAGSCKNCDATTEYQDKTIHRRLSCKTQTSCVPGEYLYGASVWEAGY
jgi:hypothetical protein